MSEQPELEINTLGGLRIALGGKAVAGIGSRKVAALLLYLAYSRSQPREALADLFWDERTSPQALSNLRWRRARLTKHLAPYLVITRSPVGMNPQTRYRLDVADFEGRLQQARAIKLRGDGLAPHAIKQLEQGMGLYPGDFLQGFFVREGSGFEEWMLREQERLHSLATLSWVTWWSITKSAATTPWACSMPPAWRSLSHLMRRRNTTWRRCAPRESQRRPQHPPIALTPFVGR